MRWELGKHGEHVFLYDKEGKLRRKFWFYPDGTVTYREWNRHGGFQTLGEKQLLGKLDEGEWPMVDCPKRGKVPIWICLGSFVQMQPPCPDLIEATVNYPDMKATVKCKARK